MSAAVGQPASRGSQKYVGFDEFIDFQVNRTRSGIRHTDLLIAVMALALAVTGYLLLFVVLDQWVVAGGFSYATRVALLAMMITVLLAWTGWKIVIPYWKRVTALYAARELEETQPELKCNLLTLVDLKQAGRRVPPHILAALEKRAALRLSQVDVEQAVDRRPLMRLAYALFAVVLVFCLYTVLSPKPVGASILRALIPVADVGVATRTRIVKVDPGDATVLARSQLEVTVDLAGEIPPEATLLFTTRDRSLVDEPVVLRDTGEGLHRFRGILAGPNGRGLLQDFTYRIAAGDARSSTFQVTVKQAPYATVENVTYHYPSYMGLDSRTQSSGEIDAWEGTRVAVRAASNMPVVSATLVMQDSEDSSLKGEERKMRLLDETHFEIEWTLEFRRDGTYPHYYRIELKTPDGQRDPVPRLYSLTIRRDLPPEIRLLHPSGDVELPANATLPISFTARDPDFMLRSVRMYFEHRDQVLDARTRHLYDAPPYRSELQGRGAIDLSQFNLQPGDVLTFWLEAWDNMQPLGERTGNRSVTPKINITVTDPVSADEAEQRREEEAALAQQKLDEAQGSQTEQRPEAEQGDEPAPDETREDAAETSDAQPGEGADAASRPDETSEQEAAQQGATDRESAGGGAPQGTDQSQTPSDSQTPQQATHDADGQGQGAPQPGQQPDAPPSQQGGQGESRSAARDAAPQGQPPQPSQEAHDDEALERLFQKYRDEIEQERQQRQQGQQTGDRNGQPRTGEPQGDPAARQRQPGQQPDPSQPQPQDGDQGGTSQDDTSTQDGQRSDEGMRDGHGAQSATDPAQSRDGATEASRPQGEPNEQRPGEQTEPGAPPSDPSRRDRRASEDSRRPEGRPPTAESGSPQAGDQPQARDPAEPMPGDSSAGESTDGAQGESQGDSRRRPSADPSGQNPEGGGASDDARPEGASRRPADPRAADEKPGERGGSSRTPPEPSPPSRTGGQPNGPDDSQPGEGRRDGQRSEQPSPGERGSSQQASEGSSGSEQRGPGEPGESAGSQTEGGSPEGEPPSGSQTRSDRGEPRNGNARRGESGASPQNGDKPPQPGEPDSSRTSGDDSGQPSEQAPTGDEAKRSTDPKPGAESPREGSSESEGASQQRQPQGADQQAGKQSGQEGSHQPGGEQEGSGQQGGDQQGGRQQGGSQQSGGQQGGNQQGGDQQGGDQQGGDQQGGAGQPNGTPSDRASTGRGNGSDGAAPSSGGVGSGTGGGEGAEPADLADKRRATELVLRRLQDEMSRGEVSQDLLRELGWTEDNLRDFMERLDRRLSDTGEDQSPEAQARRRQFQEILRGIDYSSTGRQQTGPGTERPAEGGTGLTPRRPAPSEFRDAEQGLKNRLSRETRSK